MSDDNDEILTMLRGAVGVWREEETAKDLLTRVLMAPLLPHERAAIAQYNAAHEPRDFGAVTCLPADGQIEFGEAGATHVLVRVTVALRRADFQGGPFRAGLPWVHPPLSAAVRLVFQARDLKT